MFAKYVSLLSIKSCLTLFPLTSSDSEQKPCLASNDGKSGRGCQIGTHSRGIGIISLTSLITIMSSSNTN